MDMSLDDIIKKNSMKRGPQKLRARIQNITVGRRKSLAERSTGRSRKLIQKNNTRDNKPPRRPLQSKDNSRGILKNSGIADARLKIIQKTRLRLTDAREKLSELAKQTDARNKIKSRNLGMNHQMDRRRDRVRIGRGSFNSETLKKPPVVLQRSFRNKTANIRDTSSLIRCTVNQMDDFPAQPAVMYPDDVEMPLPFRPHNDLSNIKVVTQNEYTHYGQEYTHSTPEPVYDHYDSPAYSRQLEPQRNMILGRASGARMSQEMRARLDTPAKSAYSYPPNPQSPPPTQGHRIVVSNLHSSVTHEDIKELFEDIGPLLTSRLVRAGTAEVIYKLQKDAKKAVEAYHNRQLDGQPMKCLLVNPRPSSSTSGALRSSNMPLIPKFPSSSKSMVVPDLSAIHKALFTNK